MHWESKILLACTFIYVNYIKFEASNWKLSVFSCKWWSKNFICRHVIAVVVKMKLIEYQVASTTLLLGQKNELVDIWYIFGRCMSNLGEKWSNLPIIWNLIDRLTELNWGVV